MGEHIVLNISRRAAADLSDHQYGAVVMDANGDVVKAAADAVALGVLQNDPKLGEAATVMVQGVSYAKIAGAVTPGGAVATDANGQFVAQGAAVNSVGIAMGVGAAGETHTILLK